jgi:Rrf2 family transcriptional regulator, cysteine metabolism repressor
MNVSQKCQYAIRAILELSKGQPGSPMKSSEIAAKQAVPARFLEVILNELKSSGLVQAKRGVQGGFLLVCKPEDLTVGRIIRLVDGPLDPVRCTGESGKSQSCPLRENCCLIDLWTRAKAAVEAVYDGTTFKDLVDRERDLDRSLVSNYCI